MGSVFEDILETLGLINREDPAAILVAEKIIELAQTGVHDPIRLKQLTLMLLGYRTRALLRKTPALSMRQLPTINYKTS